MRAIALALACSVLALLVPAQGALGATQASLPDIEDEVMCIVCGTLLAESESPQADRERALIRKLIAQGDSKDEIKDALVAQYGPRVLATPSGHGFDLLAWIVPNCSCYARHLRRLGGGSMRIEWSFCRGRFGVDLSSRRP